MASSHLFWLVLYSLALLATAYATPDGNSYDYESNAQVVEKSLIITWEDAAPNGAPRKIIKTNGQFPAPALIFNEGDNVKITVYNRMPFNTTIHWHGLTMQGTPWSDGVPGLSQKPIEPSQSYVYRFKASPSGTYWYHSHSRATLLDGLYGPLYVRPKPESPTPWSLISKDPFELRAMAKAAANPKFIVYSDWSNYTSWDYEAAQETSNLDIFCRDSVLVNGKGSIFCPSLDYLMNNTNPVLLELLGEPINDKGCLPFVYNTEGPYTAGGKPSLIPPGLQSGCAPTNGSIEIIEIDPEDRWVSLNLIMAATFMLITASIDKHDMWIYEIDGHYVEPQKAQGVLMYPGERYSVLIKLNQLPGDYIFRAPSTLSQTTSTFGLFRYKGGRRTTLLPGVIPASTGFIDYGGTATSPDVKILDGGFDHVPPFPPTPPAPTADAMYVLSMGRWFAPWRWTFTGKAIIPVDANAYDPLLYNPNSPLAMDSNLTIRTKNGSWIDLVCCVGALPNEPSEISHAIHKHGSKVWLIGQGSGIWNYSTTAEAMAAEPHKFNLVNPNYRDTVITTSIGAAWYVLRYQVTNPGPWLLHCHVETHLTGGMGMVIMDGVDKWPKVPPQYALGHNGY